MGFVLGVTACDLPMDEQDHSFTGPPLLEFAPTLPGGVHERGVAFDADSDASTTITVTIQYVSEPPESDVNGEIEATEATDAVQGQHYSFPDGNTFTIAAGENATEFSVRLMGGGLENGESRTLVLGLLPGDGYEVSANYGEFTITATKGGSS